MEQGVKGGVIIQSIINDTERKEIFFCLKTRGEKTRSRVIVVMPAKRLEGSVGEGEEGKKAKVTQHAGG